MKNTKTKLRKLIEEKGLRMDFVAKSIGIARSELSVYVNDKRTPTLKRAKLIADWFDLKIEDIFFSN